MNDFTDRFRRDMSGVAQQEKRNLVGGVANMVRDMLVRPLTGAVKDAEREAQREVGRGMNGVRRDVGLPEQQLPRGGTPGYFPAERGGYPGRASPMDDARIRVSGDGRIAVDRGGGYNERLLPNGGSQIRVDGKVYTEGGRPQMGQQQAAPMTLGQSMANQTPEQKRQSAITLGLGDKEYSNLIDQQRNHEERVARGLPAARTSPLDRAARTERANFARSGMDEESWSNLKFVENDFQNRLHGGGNVTGSSPLQQVLSVDLTQPAFRRPSVNAPAAATSAEPASSATSYPVREPGKIEVAALPASPAVVAAPTPTAQQLTEQGGLKASDYTTMRGGGDNAVSTAPAAAPTASSDVPAGLKNVDAYQRWKQQNPGLSQ